MQKCPNGVLGDIQLETVLTPLLFQRKKPNKGELWNHKPADTQPNLKILDLGCGGARMLAGLMAFPEHIRRQIEYVGCEEYAEGIRRAEQNIAELERLTLNNSKFFEALGLVTLAMLTDFENHQQEFDYVFMINVLHHVRPSEFPRLFATISRLLKDGGYFIVHDFYFANSAEQYDLSKYCEDSIFFGPNHLSAFFAMASTQTGVYRTMRRVTRDGLVYDLYTFILHFENELSQTTYEESSRNDDYFSFYEIPSGLEASLTNILEECYNFPRSDWIERYARYVEARRQEVRTKWRKQLGLVMPEWTAKWIAAK